MKVYKFGGASVKDAHAVRNVVKIIGMVKGEPLVVVVSAMGKTTNLLEKFVGRFVLGGHIAEDIQRLKLYHEEIIRDLFSEPTEVLTKLNDVVDMIKNSLDRNIDYDQLYDQVISQGELLSTLIVSKYTATHFPVRWIDAREYISTNQSFREAKVDWPATRSKIQNLKQKGINCPIITQGFIGRANNGMTTTLGREGSDYSAAIFASCLDAESVTIWKDVPGVMTADPKRLPGATVFPELPYQEAAEMTFYGASVIHPKTIQPLANADIPLYVKNFDDPSLPGTKIHACQLDEIPPLIVFKDNQCLVSCKMPDYSFVSENQLSVIFKTLSDAEVKINVMQNSAISFSFCVDYRENKIQPLIEALSKLFEVYYNTNLTLVTIKNYTPELCDEYRAKPGILLEQLSRSTVQWLFRSASGS
jgi:aspartate kinase